MYYTLEKMTLTQLLRVEDLFDSLGEEEEQELDREFEVKENPELEEIIRNYEKVLKFEITTFDDFYGNFYDKILKISTEKFTSEDIKRFSLILGDYQDNKKFVKKGFYLSYLINKSNDYKFIIYTNHLATKVDRIGYKNNGKYITVKGDAGDEVGNSMKDGKVNVFGNAGDYVGWSMKGGKIIIKGDVGDHLGSNLSGGEIHVYGDYRLLPSDINGGNIYHKGKLIVKDGRKLI